MTIENAVFIAIHPATYRSGGFLAHGVLNVPVTPKRSPSFKYLGHFQIIYIESQNESKEPSLLTQKMPATQP